MPAWLDETGTGPPVALLHGWTGFRGVWADLAVALERDGHRVLRLDLPGWGDHPAPRGMRHDAFGYADALDRFVRERGPMALVGHSLGGQVALVLASRHPTLVTRVAVIGAPVVPAPMPIVPPRNLVHVVGLPLVGRRLAQVLLWILARRPDRVTTAYRRAVHEGERLMGEPGFADIVEGLRERLRTTHSSVLAESLWRIARMDLRPLLPRVRQQVLAIVGERDWSVNPANSQTIARAIPGARLLRVPDAAHIAFLERPDIVTPAILDFLKGPST